MGLLNTTITDFSGSREKTNGPWMAMITIDILLYGMMNDVMAVQNSSVSVRLKSTWRFNPPTCWYFPKHARIGKKWTFGLTMLFLTIFNRKLNPLGL